jgi:formate dehydrogenase
MAKCVMVLYPDPVDGYPPKYARDSIPEIHNYPGGATLPTPSTIDFTPGELLGSVSGALGLRKFFEEGGHELVVTSDKDGPDSEFERELHDADIVISQPFWPAYLSKERIAKAPNLKLALTAGIGSDHVDLDAAKEHGITVAEVTYSNSISVAEHAVMQILTLVRNFVPSHRWATDGGWNIADCVERAYDLEGMDVGVIAAGRIGRAVLRRLAPFDVHLHYTDTHRLAPEVEQQLNVTYHAGVESLVRSVDVVSVHSPLYEDTRAMFDEKLIAFPQPPPADHPWRTMPNNAMTPHVSGTTLSAQARYAAGTREILESFFAGTPIRPEYLIVEGGKLAGTGATSYQK